MPGFDLEELKARLDLLSLAGAYTDLKRVAASGGGEWAGACPFCGGRDRFRVQPSGGGGGRWLCRGCTDGKWQDGIAFGQRLWPALPFGQVCERLAVHAAGLQEQKSVPHRPGQPPAYQSPDLEWQRTAHQAVEVCARNLWEPSAAEARAYLHSRHLEDETLQYWQIGYSPGAKFGKLWVPRGVLLPGQAGDQVWYLKVALLPGDPVRCQGCGQNVPARQPCPFCGTVSKYRGVKGNRPAALFGADDLPGAWAALFVEGEMDALTAWQALRDVVAVCTLGSASNQPDLATWGAYLLPLEAILAVYDADQAGQRGLLALQALAEKTHALALPSGVKDLNEYVVGGGDLWPWLKGELLRLGLVQDD
jgi:DNA primase